MFTRNSIFSLSKVRPDPSNISHTAHRLVGYSLVSRLSVLIVKVIFRTFFHTDLTYYDHMPGVKDLNFSFYSFLSQTIFLHCIEQHEGEVIFDNF